MRTFIDIKSQKEGIKLSLENSTSLYDSALLISQNNHYGTAISLLILSIEETIKSFALCLEITLGNKSEVKKLSNNIKSRSKKDNSYMYFHEEKHEIIKKVITDLKGLSLIINLVKLFPINNKKIKGLIDFLSLPKINQNKITEILENFETLNLTKNLGLYVDNGDGKWKSPASFTVTDFNLHKEHVDYIRDVFFPKINFILSIEEEDLDLLNLYLNK